MIERLSKYSALICLLVVSVLSFLWLTRGINDPDFFWHLKTGEWLWKTGSFPIPDPFSFTTPEVLDFRQEFILKSYWLCQVLYYALFKWASWPAIALFRVLLVCGLWGVLYRFRRANDIVWFGVSLIAVLLILDSYPVERPQFVSFVCFTLLYYFLNGLLVQGRPFKSQRRTLVLLFVFMCTWAAMHGGVILGCILALLFGVTVGIRQYRCRTYNRIDLVYLIAVAFITFVAPLLNVAGFDLLRMFGIADANSLLYATNEEFYSAMKVWELYRDPTMVAFALWFILTVTGLVRSMGKLNFFELMTVAGTGFFSVLHVRYIPFFLLISIPLVIQVFMVEKIQRTLNGGICAVALFAVVFFGRDELGNIEAIRHGGWVSHEIYPVQLAEKLEPYKLSGNLFNYYLWGGYLMWRFGPELQTFSDGRALSWPAIREVLTAEMAHLQGTNGPQWKDIFNRRNVDNVILPVLKDGKVYPLTMALYKDPDWAQVFVVDNAVFFVRR